jgi:hypothetical protein
VTLEKTCSSERGIYFGEGPPKSKTKQKNYAGKLETPSKMAKNSMKHHAKSQVDAKCKIFFDGHVIDNILKRITIQDLNQSLKLARKRTNAKRLK